MLIRSGKTGGKCRIIQVFHIVIISFIIIYPFNSFAQTGGGGQNSVLLVWTATGDDKNMGRASHYDIRYSTEPVGMDTSAWWDFATLVENVPTPGGPGSVDSCLVKNLLLDQPYYFGVRVADETNNWSDLVQIVELPEVSCGDTNGDFKFDSLDLIYLLAFLYNDGPPPIGDSSGDLDNSGDVNVADAMYMINYRLYFGPPPDCK